MFSESSSKAFLLTFTSKMRDIHQVLLERAILYCQRPSRTTVRIYGKTCFKDYSVPYLFYTLNKVVNGWTFNKGCPLYSNS